MKLLAIDTATDACSCALLYDGQILERHEIAPRRHAELILPLIENLLQTANLPPKALDALAFGSGPGSFTGLRIACGVIQGLAFGLQKPVIPLSTLAAIAQQIYETKKETAVLAALDAQMQEIYYGYYRLDPATQLMTLCGTEGVCSPANIPLPDEFPPPAHNQWFVAGTAWLKPHYIDALNTRLTPHLTNGTSLLPTARYMLPHAQYAYTQGQWISAHQAQPTYLRNQVV